MWLGWLNEDQTQSQLWERSFIKQTPPFFNKLICNVDHDAFLLKVLFSNGGVYPTTDKLICDVYLNKKCYGNRDWFVTWYLIKRKKDENWAHLKSFYIVARFVEKRAKPRRKTLIFQKSVEETILCRMAQTDPRFMPYKQSYTRFIISSFDKFSSITTLTTSIRWSTQWQPRDTMLRAQLTGWDALIELFI